MKKLLSTPSLVESPFIIVKIGEYTFGNVEKTQSAHTLNVTFPDYMKSVNVVKVNGEVNTYTINMEYPITKGRDPNLLDHVFSSVSGTRELTISYGDWSSPSFIYKEEETLITAVKTTMKFSPPIMSYTITCVSKSLQLQATKKNYPYREGQPSKIILSMIKDKSTGISDVFTGMADYSKVVSKGLICTDDKPVAINGVSSQDALSYINYLVSNMLPSTAPDGVLQGAYYRLSIIDDNKNEMGGSYFTVTKVDSNATINTDSDNLNSSLEMDAYEIDIGYPGNNLVSDMSISSDDTWAILYDTSMHTNIERYSYKLDSDGNLVKEFVPSLTNGGVLSGTTAEDKSWWTSVTEFPITATITFRGLVRPTMLVSYVKLNVVFYGQRHITSGYYIITKEEDSVSGSGYKTTLSLTRIKADDATDFVTKVITKPAQITIGRHIRSSAR